MRKPEIFNISKSPTASEPMIILQKLQRMVRKGKGGKPNEYKTVMRLWGTVTLVDGSMREKEEDLGAADYILYQEKFIIALNNMFCNLSRGPSLHEIGELKKRVEEWNQKNPQDLIVLSAEEN